MIIFLFSLVLVIFITNFILKKYQLLLNNTGLNHQSFTSFNKIPLSGGILILYFFYYNFKIIEFNLLIYLTAFFLLGLAGDTNIIRSPTRRFFLQVIFLIILIIDLELNIYDIRISFFNILLENFYFNVFFVSFCFLVLINGSNFIDGNNGLSLGYFCIIFYLIFELVNNQTIYYEKDIIFRFLILINVILIFNILNKLYLGDNGIYLLSVYSGYLLVDIYIKNPNFSPYFIVNFLWYPSFEIFFSTIRKLVSRKSPMKPDTQHLHQLLYNFLLKKIKLQKVLINSLTGVLINCYNFMILFISINHVHNTKIQISCILLSIIVYILFYILLLKKKLFFKE